MLNSCGSQGKKRANLSSKTFEIKGIKIQGDLSMQTNVAEQTSTLIYKAPGLSFSGTITAAHSRLSCGRCPAASALAHTWSHKWYQVLLPLQVRSHFSQTVIHTPFPFPFFFFSFKTAFMDYYLYRRKMYLYLFFISMEAAHSNNFSGFELFWGDLCL